MKRAFLISLGAVAALAFAASAAEAPDIVIGGKDAWTAVKLTGFNPYGDKKSFYATPLKFADWNSITVHSRGSKERNGAEENTILLRFDLAKAPKGAKVKSATLVFPVINNAGKTNAVQVFEVLVPWTDKVDWKTVDGATAWQEEGCHGEKDKKKVADLAIPDKKYDAKAPTEMTVDVTPMVKSWLAGANNGLKLEMTGGYVTFAMKGFRLEVAVE